MFKQDAAFTVQTNVSCGEKEGQLQTLQAEASNLPSGLDATQNISYPWPYLYSRKGKKLHVNEIGTLMSTTLFQQAISEFPQTSFQNEGRCSAFDIEIIFHPRANKTHFHKKGCAPSPILKVRVFGSRKWHIT